MPRGEGVTKDKAEMVIQVAMVKSNDIRKGAYSSKGKLFQHGVIRETARLTGLHRETVSKILKHYDETGEIPSYSHTPRIKAPTKVTEQMAIALREEIRSFIARGEVPTVDKLHRALVSRAASTAETENPIYWNVSRTTTYKLMKQYEVLDDFRDKKDVIGQINQ